MAHYSSKPIHPSIERVRRLANLMDSAFTLPVIKKKVGLDPILSLIPAGGDLIAALLALYPLWVAYELGVPRVTMLRMAINVAADAALGLVPVLGDVADVFFKSNQRNLAILEQAYQEMAYTKPYRDARGTTVVDVKAEPIAQ